MCENEVGEPDIKILESDLDIEDTKEMTPDDLYRYFHKGLKVIPCVFLSVKSAQRRS